MTDISAPPNVVRYLKAQEFLPFLLLLSALGIGFIVLGRTMENDTYAWVGVAALAVTAILALSKASRVPTITGHCQDTYASFEKSVEMAGRSWDADFRARATSEYKRIRSFVREKGLVRTKRVPTKMLVIETASGTTLIFTQLHYFKIHKGRGRASSTGYVSNIKLDWIPLRRETDGYAHFDSATLTFHFEDGSTETLRSRLQGEPEIYGKYLVRMIAAACPSPSAAAETAQRTWEKHLAKIRAHGIQTRQKVFDRMLADFSDQLDFEHEKRRITEITEETQFDREVELYRRKCRLRAEYDSEELINRLADQEIWVGMNRDELISSRGEPEIVDERNNKGNRYETWKYDRVGKNRFLLVVDMEDDRVTGWSSKERSD